MTDAAHKIPSVPRGDLLGYEPMGLVCAALFIAWLALICRIVSIW